MGVDYMFVVLKFCKCVVGGVGMIYECYVLIIVV